jgi:pimeloyl-ACP methyl ester carboxylesterase
MTRHRSVHPPLLLVHDRDDVETPARGSQSLASAWPGADLLLTEGLGHRRVLWDPAVVERTVAFARGR